MPSSVAPLMAGWQRRVGSLPGPLASASGESSNQSPMIELLIDGSWVDITSRVMVRDNAGNISITRGQTSEGQDPVFGSCLFQLNNRDGLFSPANAMSPYYGKIGRNTQVRVSVPKGDDKSYRFWGEIPAWPESWDSTNTDIWVDITAAGILRRLGQSSTPLRGTMYRGLMSSSTPTPKAYWPLEDLSAATSIASALPGGAPMRINGTPSLASDTGFACSAPLPAMSSSLFTGIIPKYTVTGQSQVRFLLYLPTPPPDTTQLIKVGTVGGTVPFWCISYGTGGGLALRGMDTDGLTLLYDTGFIAFAMDGVRVRVSMELTQNGANVDWAVSLVNADTRHINGLSGTFVSATVGRMTTVTVTPGRTVTDGVFGHISMQSQITLSSNLASEVTAFNGEAVSNRFSRLCGEQGVNNTLFNTLSLDTMGPQLPSSFLSLLQDCVDVDQGMMLERETKFGLAYKPRIYFYDQDSSLSLSYPGKQLSKIPLPVPDDMNTKNSVTATRVDGSSATSTLSTGALSVMDPPNGVGSGYSDSITLNVESDSDLEQHAAWRVHLGTVDEPRYPSISVNLSHPSMVTQRKAALDVLFGDRITVTSPPSRLGGTISQQVIGIQETITKFEHRITYVCQPESPYHVAVAGASRAGSDTSYLSGDMTPTSTSVTVSVPGNSAPWTNSAVDTPFRIVTGGEVMRVDSIDSSIISPNPYLDTDLTGWTGQNAAIAPSTDQFYDIAARSMLITPDGVSASGGATATRSATGTITAAATYVACLWAYSPAGSSDLRPAVDWYDSGGVFLSSSLGSAFTVPAGTWTFLTQSFAAPASSSSAVMRARHGGTPSSAAIWYVWAARLLTTAGTPTSPQTFTLTRAVNGVVKTHQNNDPIAIFDISYVGL